MAASSIALIHNHGIIHADISARNFLVADDLSIKLCDFSGSAIGNQDSLVQEEDRYHSFPDEARSTMTDMFALGCLIFEIITGLRPYNEINDDRSEVIQVRYAAKQFPSLRGIAYGDIIYKCWTQQSTTVDQVIHEIANLKEDREGI